LRLGEGETGGLRDEGIRKWGETGRLRIGIKKLALDLNRTCNYNVITDS
jgi:hypothetical protein